MVFLPPDVPERRVLSPQSVVSSAVIDQSTNTLTAAIDLGTARLAAILMPAAWDAAQLTFQASADGVAWVDLYDASGNEVVVEAAADRAIVVPVNDFLGVRHLKVRSGTAGVPVNQAAPRTLTLVSRP